MQASIELSTKPCFLCSQTENTVKVRVKELDFAGVVCASHLFQIMKRNGSSEDPIRPPQKEASRVSNAS